MASQITNVVANGRNLGILFAKGRIRLVCGPVQRAAFQCAWLGPRSGEIAQRLPLAGPRPQRAQDQGRP